MGVVKAGVLYVSDSRLLKSNRIMGVNMYAVQDKTKPDTENISG
jgi:hypothetical protein